MYHDRYLWKLIPPSLKYLTFCIFKIFPPYYVSHFLFLADPSGFILFPLVVHSFDLIVSSAGLLSIRGSRESGLKASSEDPMAILQKGYSITIFLALIAFVMVSPGLNDPTKSFYFESFEI